MKLSLNKIWNFFLKDHPVHYLLKLHNVPVVGIWQGEDDAGKHFVLKLEFLVV